MQLDEKVFLGVALAAVAAVILFRKGDPVIGQPTDERDTLPATAYVGLSQTPENSDLSKGPFYLMANERYAFWPPLQNFLPTVSSGQVGQVVENPMQFVRRWAGSLHKKDERIIS